MRYLVHCSTCSVNRMRAGSSAQYAKLYLTEIEDKKIARIVCEHGHKVVYVMQAFKFDLLAEVAVNAIFDGYYREAVSSFNSCFERFQEFYIKAIIRSRGHEDALFMKLWKEVKNQSERQYGAYLFLCGLEEGQPPPTLPNEFVSFRNKVIHQGIIPTHGEAIKFGQTIADVINPVLTQVFEGHFDAFDQLETEELIAGIREAKEGEQPVTHSSSTMFDRHCKRDKYRTIQEHLDMVKRQR